MMMMMVFKSNTGSYDIQSLTKIIEEVNIDKTAYEEKCIMLN